MAAKRSWKKLLEKVESLFAEGRVNLYATTVLLVKIFNDRDFRHEVKLESDYDASDWLDKYITDTDLTLLELRKVLEQFPDESQWKETTIWKLYAATKKTTEERAETPAVNRTAWKERAKNAEEKLADSEFKCKRLESSDSDNRKRSIDYEQKIRDLENENAVLTGRIEELERLYKRELVTS